MCVDNDSRPPIHPIAGGSAGSRDLRLTSSDGTRVMAHAARASKPTGAGMVVIPDVRGLHPYYKELADRFSVEGPGEPGPGCDPAVDRIRGEVIFEHHLRHAHA